MHAEVHLQPKLRPLLINFMFLVTRPHVILMAASIGHYWWRYVLLVTWFRFSASCSCSARLCFEFSRLLLLINYGSAQFLCVLYFSRKNSFPGRNVGPPFPAVRLFSRSVGATIGQEPWLDYCKLVRQWVWFESRVYTGWLQWQLCQEASKPTWSGNMVHWAIPFNKDTPP